MLWFKFIFGFIFFSNHFDFCFSLSCIHYHNLKQREIKIKDKFKAALDPCSLINSLAIYFDGVSCCKCLILRILNTDSFKTYQG